MHHRGGATVQDGVEGIPAGEGQSDIFTKSREARLLGGGAGGGAFSLDGVPDRALEATRIQAAFNKIIGCSRLHGFDIDLPLALAGEQNDGSLAAPFEGCAKKFYARLRPEPVIDEANLVLISGHRFEALGEILFPLELDLAAAHLVEEIPRQDEIVLIVLHEQDAEGLVGVYFSHDQGFFAGNSTISNQ
jgi:hypothetical protein